jgi:septum formation protein
VLESLSASAPLILGSGSPRRKEILAAARVPFEVVAGDADESIHDGEDAGTYLARVVLAKLTSVRERASARPGGLAPGRVVLVADTSVVVDGAILGKPADEREGLAMLARLRGRTHDVQTRFAIGGMRGEPVHASTVRTRVTFRAVDDAEARAYVASGEGRDKAGGYAVQGLAATFVERIDGSYSNVVGLPACEVVVALRALGLLS